MILKHLKLDGVGVDPSLNLGMVLDSEPLAGRTKDFQIKSVWVQTHLKIVAWCFTMDPAEGHKQEACDIPKCPEKKRDFKDEAK